jgi:hypothetical protein
VSIRDIVVKFSMWGNSYRKGGIGTDGWGSRLPR